MVAVVLEAVAAVVVRQRAVAAVVASVAEAHGAEPVVEAGASGVAHQEAHRAAVAVSVEASVEAGADGAVSVDHSLCVYIYRHFFSCFLALRHPLCVV